MATIRKRKDNYEVGVYCGSSHGKNIYKYATFRPDPKKSERSNQKALNEFAVDFERKCKTGTSGDSNATFETFSNEWMESYAAGELEKTTIATYRGLLDRIILPRIGYMKISAIRPMTIQRFVNDLRSSTYSYSDGKRTGRYSEECIRNSKAVISSILSSAWENGLIPSNPCLVRIRKSKNQKELERGKQKMHCFTIDEAALFLDVIRKPIPIMAAGSTQKRNGKLVKIKPHLQGTMNVSLQLQTLYTLALYSGCRRGELLGLVWKNVNFDDSCIIINQSLAYTPQDGTFVKNPKSNSGFRDIDLPPSVMKMLMDLKDEVKQRMRGMGSEWKGSRTLVENFCFTQDNGLPMALSTPRLEMQRIIKVYNASRSEDQPELPLIKFHELRHTTASILVASGLDPETVAERLGHSDPSITLRVYSHAFKERDKLASEILQKRLGGEGNTEDSSEADQNPPVVDQ